MPKTVVSNKQLAANRLNAGKSTGPRTNAGKAKSSRNALKHGLLASEAVIRAGDGAEDPEEFDALFEHLMDDLQPHGALEQMLVERIVTGFWRLRRAQRFEVGAIRRTADDCRQPKEPSEWNRLLTKDNDDKVESQLDRRARRSQRLRLERATLLYALPNADHLNMLARYETMIDRELHRALTRFERLQRARKGGQVAAPVTMDVDVGGVNGAPERR